MFPVSHMAGTAAGTPLPLASAIRGLKKASELWQVQRRGETVTNIRFRIQQCFTVDEESIFTGFFPHQL
jgi:hypothetical protein